MGVLYFKSYFNTFSQTSVKQIENHKLLINNDMYLK